MRCESSGWSPARGEPGAWSAAPIRAKLVAAAARVGTVGDPGQDGAAYEITSGVEKSRFPSETTPAMPNTPHGFSGTWADALNVAVVRRPPSACTTSTRFAFGGPLPLALFRVRPTRPTAANAAAPLTKSLRENIVDLPVNKR
jgi:hypothetical protein